MLRHSCILGMPVGKERIAMQALAQSVTGISRSPIRLILDRAAAFPDAIHLEIGQPDFEPPAHVIDAAVRAARNEYTGYTANAGMPALREAVVVKLARENNLHVSPQNIMVTVGAMQAVFSTMTVLLNPGDEILLPDPGYGNFAMAARLNHAVPRFYPTVATRGFEPDMAALERMVNDRTKALFINSPCNPTGAVYSEATLRACLEFCRRHDLYLVSDETYDRLVYEGQHISPAQWDDEGRVISIFTTSKTYAMTGWRVGFAVANDQVISAMTKIQEPTTSCVNTVAQHAAVAALLGPQDCVASMRQEYQFRRDLALALATDNELSVSVPHGAFYMLVDISGQPADSVRFACDLVDAEHLAVAPGRSFGDQSDHYVRLSFCARVDSLQAGIPRLANYLHRAIETTGPSYSRPVAA
ncbi:MAG: pyridoxal phosphate-dependent aminotransferase [Anaerolineae bacterium]|jgi:aspartate/methionine/tyrosine aminotransferase|nr:pyridoxal phosphate-dependent aminotransferase [Chloroflexota bacterium]